MTAPTQPVTCRFFGQDGAPVAARVSFRLTVQDSYNGLIVSPETEYVTCDATTGIGVINLFPNALGANGSQYTVKATDTVTGRRILDTTLCTVPNSPCYLDLILNQEPFPTIDAAGLALIEAQGALALVTAQADIATAQAGIATTQATAAAASAVTAADRASSATASASTASNAAISASNSSAAATVSAAAAAANVVSSDASAATATAQAVIATAGGTTATTQAGIATAQAGIATAQAVIATTGAGTATTKATAADASATSAATSAATATAQAATAVAQVGVVAASATASATSAASATASAAAASTSKDLAITAWAASTAPAETLAAISKTIHTGSIVKAIIYDTSKDADGGAWRKRCQDKSWYTEALGFTGTWGGECASNAAGWTACGSVVGGAYKSTADGKFYTPLSSSTQTEIFRGNVREFPALVAIVAESARVVIYDLTQTGCPMWMVFVDGGTTGFIGWGSAGIRTQSCIAALNGAIVTGASTGSSCLISFAKDDVRLIDGVAYYLTTSRRIESRNALTGFASGGDGYAIVSIAVNDVAITVLDTAPIDPATGLPVPTIAVATAGGVSVIKDDGTVVNITCSNASYTISNWVAFLKGSTPLLAYSLDASGPGRQFRVSGIPTANVSITLGVKSPSLEFYSSPATFYVGQCDLGTPLLANTASTKFSATHFGSNEGLSLFSRNPATPTKGMVAAITNTYNSGWQIGDSRGAYLADSVAGTITASGELVTNGTFTTDATGWTASNSTLAIVSGQLEVTNTAAAAGIAEQVITTVTGKSYVLAYTFKRGTSSSVTISIAANGGASIIGVATASASDITSLLTFAATSTATKITLQNDQAVSGRTGYFDNITVKLAEPDRSVKGKGLVINGTLTKTAVATAAQLVAYSGFSASNYLEQPYNSDLDFSTTGFSGVLWLTEAPNSAIEYLINRDSATPAASIRLWVSVAGFLVFELYDGTTTRTATGTVAIDDSTRKCVMFDYSAGTLNIYVNNVLYATATGAALLTLNNAAATLRIGESKAGSQPLTNGSIALVRLSATVMSADQREHIYRTELPLFQANAQCCIAGTSTAVTALAYDDVADTLHVGTSWGRSGFRDLLRIDSEATTTGAITSLSASGGTVLTGGTSAKVYQPALLLRDELRRKDEARKALGRIPVFFDYTATASQTAFVVPKGYTAKALYKNGTLMRETTTGVYWTRSNDGFAETCTLSVGATVSDWISVMAVRT